MHLLKLLFQELHVRPTTPRRESLPSGAQLKITAWGTSGDIWAIVFQRETDSPAPGSS